MTLDFETLEQVVLATAEMARPPERLNVVQAAEKYRFISNPGAFVGQFDPDHVPYANEPMEVLTSLDYTGMIFVGPAQASKTDPFLNWVVHSTMCDPADMMFISPSTAAARDFSIRRLQRLFRQNPEIRKKIIAGRNNENTFDVRFVSGALLTLSWPTINELSGKPIPRLWITDYDRIEDDVDGEGAAYDLAAKRATTFRRFAMTVAESSPGKDVDPAISKWIRKSPHEAPPTTGILALYNRGDRRLRHWRCPYCKNPFEPKFSLFQYPDSRDFMEAAEQVVLVCPTCHGKMRQEGDERNGVPGKRDLDRQGKWIKDGEVWMANGRVEGKAARSNIASFWLKGPCAAMQDWKDLVHKYLLAMEEFEKTGNYSPLRTTVNTDQGEPFFGPEDSDDLLPENIKATARDLGHRVVPKGVRFLIATVDVQKNRFVVQVHGYGHGSDEWVVDRYDVKKSERRDQDDERYLVAPGAYPEDWYLLVPQVILKTYPLADESGRHMMIKFSGCDSGGRAGVTKNAYAFYRWLRDECTEDDVHRRFRLLKGGAPKGAPRVQTVFPDSERSDRHADARGEVPLLLFHSDLLKDANRRMLDRSTPDGGLMSFPDWLPDEFYSELTAETRTDKGWRNDKKRRNEAWDLWQYARGIFISEHIRGEHIDWDDPPSWAAEWDKNSLVFLPEHGRPFAAQSSDSYDLAKLGEILG